MAKRDIRLAKTIGGWHLTGFLNIETGAKLKAILANLSVPRDAGDERSASQRRMDALGAVCDGVLEHGLPADNGVRPHITVTVEAAALKRALRPTPGQMLDLDLTPAVLEGFGHIGPMFVQHLLCDAEITPLLIERIGPRTAVLDVGDTKRLATDKQAKSISFRQRGGCAGPGCTRPIAHNHHVMWFARGGRTDLDNLIGLCHKCHLLVHAEQLHVTGAYGTGFSFGINRGSPVHRRAG